MAIKVNGTTVIDDSRELRNIAAVDGATATAISAAGVGGGGTEFITKATVSSATLNIDFTSSSFDSSKYDNYMFVINGLQDDSVYTYVDVQYSTDGGSSFITGSSYYWSVTRGDYVFRNEDDSGMQICDRVARASNQIGGLNSVLYLTNPHSTTLPTFISGISSYVYDASSTYYTDKVADDKFAGYNSTTSAVNGIRFTSSLGSGYEFNRGSIAMYGIKKS
jgi:hypothetical protein